MIKTKNIPHTKNKINKEYALKSRNKANNAILFYNTKIIKLFFLLISAFEDRYVYVFRGRIVTPNVAKSLIIKNSSSNIALIKFCQKQWAISPRESPYNRAI